MARLIVLGCGTPTPGKARWGTSFLLQVRESWLMIDCGPASTYKMYAAGVPATAVDNLFFTHHHSDHNSDYACFLLTRFDMHTGREPDLSVYGPAPTERLTRMLLGPEEGAYWPDVVARTNHRMSLNAYRSRGGVGERRPPSIQARDIGPGQRVNGAGWTVTAAEVEHAQPWLTCYGYRVETDDAVVVFAGDTRPCKAVTNLARDADLLVMEGTRLEAQMEADNLVSETGTESCGRQAAEAGAKRLLVNHQHPSLDEPEAKTSAIAEVKRAYDGPVIWGEELLAVDI